MTQEPPGVSPPPPQPANPSTGSPGSRPTGTSTGLDPRLSGVLAYLFWIVGGILFLATEKEHATVRFHAAQSVVLAIAEVVVWIAFALLTAIPFLGVLFGILALFFWILVLLLALFLMWKAYQLERYKLPFLGEYAEKLAAKQF